MLIKAYNNIILRCISFLIFIIFIFISLSFPPPVSAAKVTLNEWKDITVPTGNDLEFTLDYNDFPPGSNFVGSGSANIRFYLGKKKPRDNVLGDFFAYSGAQAFWDLQSGVHYDWMMSDYGQSLTKEQVLERHFEMIKDAGVRWIRFDWTWFSIYTWDLLDGQGKSLCTHDAAYKYLETDLIFKLAKKHNIKILADLSTTPRKISIYPNSDWPMWAFNPPRDLYENNCSGGSCGNLRTSGSFCFNEFVRRMAERYRPGGKYYDQFPDPDETYGITHWEIWNEQDYFFWNPPDRLYESYIYFLKGAYETIDQIRSSTGADLKVLFGGLALPEVIDSRFPDGHLQSYYNKAASLGLNLNNYFDIMSMHRYDQGINTSLPATRNILDQNGASNKPIWVTETSSGSNETEQTNYLNNTLIPIYNNRNQYKLEKIFWWVSKEYYGTSNNFPDYINGTCCADANDTWGANTGVLKNFYRPKDVYKKLAEKIQITDWKEYNKTLLAPNSSITFSIPSTDLLNNQQYILFYSVNNKISTGKTINISLGYLSPTPSPTPAPTLIPLNTPVGICASDNRQNFSWSSPTGATDFWVQAWNSMPTPTWYINQWLGNPATSKTFNYPGSTVNTRVAWTNDADPSGGYNPVSNFSPSNSAYCPAPTITPTSILTPTRTPTPTGIPAIRPALCQSATISSQAIQPGQSFTITSTAKVNDIKRFTYAFYNVDNLFPPPNGTPKPICVANVGQEPPNPYCPAGSHRLIITDSFFTTRQSNNHTFTFSDIDQPDVAWSNQKPVNFQVNAYFTNSLGQFSAADGNCVVRFNLSGTASPTPTPTPTPPPIPTKTPTPIPTQTPMPTPTKTPTPTLITATPISTTPVLCKSQELADANCDEKVDGIDYTIWLKNNGKPVTGGAREGDFDGDRKVTAQDLTIWINNFSL